METWPGVGDRIREGMRARNYWNDKTGKPDVLRFSLDHRYVPQLVYKWLNGGVTPDRANLERLARDLGTTAPRLLFGNDVDKAPSKRQRRTR